MRAAALPHVGPDDVPGLVWLLARGADVHLEALGELTVGGRAVEPDSIARRGRAVG